MTPITNLQSEQPARLDRALENAVTHNWDELMPDSQSGLIHIEYQTRDDGSLDYLFIWASTIRGYWNLVCELWMRPLWSHAAGIRFGNDYHSTDLTIRLESLMAHENEYSKLPDRRGLIQVYPPAEMERTEARRCKNALQNNDASMSLEQHLAA